MIFWKNSRLIRNTFDNNVLSLHRISSHVSHSVIELTGRYAGNVLVICYASAVQCLCNVCAKIQYFRLNIQMSQAKYPLVEDVLAQTTTMHYLCTHHSIEWRCFFFPKP